MKQIQHWIDGQLSIGASQRVGPVFNPATGHQTGEVALATAADVDAAVKAARSAFETWRFSSLAQRQNIMFAYRELVAARKMDFAKLLTAEHGKTIDDAMGEVQRGLEVIEFACNIAHLLKGDFSEQVSTGVDTYTIRQPLGVVAGITPFNFPAMVPMWMYPLAIACGNTFILKPSEKDPSSSLLAAELLAAAGLPDGVFNVVHGDKEAVDALLTHPMVAAISFVGSTPIARYIYETGTRNGKRVQALGGAKNHMIVLPDADMDLAADAAVSAGYGSAGERCMAISAVVAVGEAGDGLIDKVRASTLSEAEVEAQMIAFLEPLIGKGKSPMCGNSICQDRRFLARYMPALEAYFHYRNLDVSTFKELVKRWKPEIAAGVTKEGKHTALADIYESIAELKYYREHFIKA